MEKDFHVSLPEGCKAVIFNMDTALYDSTGFMAKAYIANLNHPNLFSSEKTARKAVRGKDLRNKDFFYETFFEQVAENCATEPEDISQWYTSSLIPKMVRLTRRYHAIYPWVKREVQRLRSEGVKVVVISDYEAAARRLKVLGFETTWADTICEMPTMGGLLPCHQAIRRLCIQLDLRPAECVLIGGSDSLDGAAALGAGMPFQKVL